MLRYFHAGIIWILSDHGLSVVTTCVISSILQLVLGFSGGSPHVLGLAVSEYNNKIPIVKLPTDRSRGTLFLADSILRAHAGLHPSSFHLVPPVNPRHFSSRKENEFNASLRYGPVIADSSLTPTRTMILPPRGARSASREFAPKRCTAPTIYLWIIFDGWVASELERFSHPPPPGAT